MSDTRSNAAQYTGESAGSMSSVPPDTPVAADRADVADRAGLAKRQAALVAALVAGAELPAGFDPKDVGIARDALLRKRSGEVQRHWPLLADLFGPQWTRQFTDWAGGRPPSGALRDGWDLARHLADEGTLIGPAAGELAAREAALRYDGRSAPRRRRLPMSCRIADAMAVQIFGRTAVYHR